MLEALFALLVSILPTCVEEDDPWCVIRHEPGASSVYVNLGQADPAPLTVEVPR